MTIDELRRLLLEAPLVASVQATPDSAVDSPQMLAALARASIDVGVRLLRCEGAANIAAIRSATGAPTIGLEKRTYPDSDVYITATAREVAELLATGSEVIALDATKRRRPKSERLKDLIAQVHAAGRLAMADCDSVESAETAIACGADILGTTLAGYTGGPTPSGPDLELLRKLVELHPLVLAEGRYATPNQVQMARAIGAAGVVVGGALNDPVKQTRAFLSAARIDTRPVGAVDIGGTWIRFGVYDPTTRSFSQVDRAPLPRSSRERLAWIDQCVAENQVSRVGVSTGGTVDPRTGEVWESSDLIPGHVGTRFDRCFIALNDGLATAWGFACLPQYVGKRIAVLALGSGVGCGFIANHRIQMGPRGEYPRLNDVLTPEGCTIEQVLGGAALGVDSSEAARSEAKAACRQAVDLVETLLLPDVVIFAGAVGLADWLVPAEFGAKVRRHPEIPDAGLLGAAMLALFPPEM